MITKISEQLVPGPVFERGTSRVRSRGANHMAAVFGHLRFLYRVHKSQTLVTALSQTSPIHTLTSDFPKIQIIPHPRLGLPSGLFLQTFRPKHLYAHMST